MKWNYLTIHTIVVCTKRNDADYCSSSSNFVRMRQRNSPQGKFCTIRGTYRMITGHKPPSRPTLLCIRLGVSQISPKTQTSKCTKLCTKFVHAPKFAQGENVHPYTSDSGVGWLFVRVIHTMYKSLGVWGLWEIREYCCHNRNNYIRPLTPWLCDRINKLCP
jgi:hypothetical protein